MSSPLDISFTPHCYRITNHLAWILEFTTSWLYLSGLNSIFRLFTNPNSDFRSWFHAWTPFFLKLSAYWLSTYLQSERPYPACLAWYHSQYGLPLPELVWYECASWIELLHGVFYYREEITSRKGGYFRLFIYCSGMAVAPILVHMAGLGTTTQITLSFLFAMLAIPCYFIVEKISQVLSDIMKKLV